MEPNAGAFYRLPKALFATSLSLEAKVLYALLLDRTDLSAKNGWTDSAGQIFVYFTLEEARLRLGRGRNKAAAAMAELEAAGLLRRKRQGLGKPARLYVADLPAREAPQPEVPEPEVPEREIPEPEVRTPSFGKSGLPGEGAPDFPGEGPNQTERNHPEKKQTKRSKTYPSAPLSPAASGTRRRRRRMDEMEPVKKTLRENIEYDFLVRDRPEDQALLDGYVELMAEACCSEGRTFRVRGQELPAEAVRGRLMELNREHIRYVRDCLAKTAAPIANIKAYTLAALYNAPATMEQYYDALVSRDMAGA